MVDVGVGGDDPPEQRRRRSGGRGEPLGDGAGIASESLRCLVHERIGHDRAGPVREALEDRLDAAVADVGDDGRAVRGAAEPGLEGLDDRRLIGEDVRVIPFGAGQDRERRVVRVEIARVLVGFDDEGIPAAPARRGGPTARDRRGEQAPRRTQTGPAPPPRGRGRASPKSCSCRACRRPRRASARPRRRRRPAATARPGSRPRAPPRARAGPGRWR